MNLLDRLLQHDAWTTRLLLLRAADLSDDRLDRDFDLGLRNLRDTFEHVIRNMEVWTDLMNGSQARQRDGASIDELLSRLDSAALDLAELAVRIESRDAWDELWTDTHDTPPTTRTFGGAIAHVITHSMHHRAQLLYMLRRLGVVDLPEGDVLSWEQQR